MTASLDRLFALVKRELRADDVEVFAANHTMSEADNVVSARLPDGRQVAAVFGAIPVDREALARRLGVIVATFGQVFDDDGERRPSRPPSVAISLHDELRALATRARATDAVVIDAHSPVTWGSAIERTPWREVPSTPDLHDALRELHRRRAELEEAMTGEVSVPPEPESKTGDVRAPHQDVTSMSEPPPPGAVDPDELTRRRELTSVALGEIRQLSGVESLRRGRAMRDAATRDDLGWVVHSFATIYLAVLVYDGPFDELRAQRAIHDALPRIERLVLALPPFDPEPQPMGAVVSLRGRRR